MSPLRAASEQLSHQTQGGITQPARAKRAKKKSEGCTPYQLAGLVSGLFAEHTRAGSRHFVGESRSLQGANMSAICAC